MAASFYFYDLETSSGSPRSGRIMQFAGQRTDMQLKPIGEPDNILVKIADDVLPEPDAVLVHGITPQKALSEGITEAELANYIDKNIATPDTIFVGYNSIRFDDEFMRRLMYCNMYDPYQWQWKDGKSRWDLLDVMRMMRALRPEGLEWPFLLDKPTVKLEEMAKANGLLHDNAHDALSDVLALIALAQKAKEAQPDMFAYLLNMRDKKLVTALAEKKEPFIYTSGKYSSDFLKTNPVITLFNHPRRDSFIVYNLREDPAKWTKKSPEKLAKHWQARYDDELESAPLKTLMANKCPAIAPLGVVKGKTATRLSIDIDEVVLRAKALLSDKAFIENCVTALDIIENTQQQQFVVSENADEQIYDGGFYDSTAHRDIALIRSNVDTIDKIINEVKTKKVRELVPFYLARNFPEKLSAEQRLWWENYRRDVFYKGGDKSKVARFSKRLQELAKITTKEQEYLLTELQLYAESILPVPDEK